LPALVVRRLAISAQLIVLLDTGLLAFGTPLLSLVIRVPARCAGWPVGAPVGPVGMSHACKTVRERGGLSLPPSLPNTPTLHISIDWKPEAGCKIQNAACGVVSGDMLQLLLVKEARDLELAPHWEEEAATGLPHGMTNLKSLVLLPWAQSGCVDLR
jgi:hypothetical protein